MTETNKGAHTPGPWSAGPQSEISGWVDISIGGYPRNPVASATPAGPGGPEERRDSETVANARLIAAAPELLEALDLLLHDRTPWTVSCARAAIAKATGAPA